MFIQTDRDKWRGNCHLDLSLWKGETEHKSPVGLDQRSSSSANQMFVGSPQGSKKKAVSL